MRTALSSLEDDIAALEPMTIDELRAAWRSYLGAAPPKLRSADILRRCLAERLQLRAFGGDAETERALARLARAYGRGETPRAQKPTFRPGVVLTREHGGQHHRVEVLAEGFGWNGKTYRSLSQIARAITGVRWNGPRFFGLRETPEPAPARQAAGGGR